MCRYSIVRCHLSIEIGLLITMSDKLELCLDFHCPKCHCFLRRELRYYNESSSIMKYAKERMDGPYIICEDQIDRIKKHRLICPFWHLTEEDLSDLRRFIMKLTSGNTSRSFLCMGHPSIKKTLDNNI